MSKQSDALREYFHENGISNRDLAAKLGKHEATISNILSGKYGISRETATKLADVFGFSMRFLLAGEGQLVPPGGIRINQTHNTNTGDGAGAIHVDASLQAENAQLRERLQKAEAEKERLLGIIETLTTK